MVGEVILQIVVSYSYITAGVKYLSYWGGPEDKCQ